MRSIEQGIASGVIAAFSGPGGHEPDYASVVIDDDKSIVCAILPTFREGDKIFNLSIGSHVIVSFEDDGSERVIDKYQPEERRSNATKA